MFSRDLLKFSGSRALLIPFHFRFQLENELCACVCAFVCGRVCLWGERGQGCISCHHICN